MLSGPALRTVDPVVRGECLREYMVQPGSNPGLDFPKEGQ
jgi:hypothetical protein